MNRSAQGEANFFTSEMIKECMKKVTPVSLEQTIQVRLLAAFCKRVQEQHAPRSGVLCTHAREREARR